MKIIILVLIAIQCNASKKESHLNANGNQQNPLILTPLLQNGEVKEARKLSKVHGMLGVKSYSGYFTVNEHFNSNMFFWFFPSRKDYRNAPVLLWLQGGPGISSLYGLFEENGPLIFTKKRGLRVRKKSWTENHSIVYIDNPVGTGYSFTDPDGYSRNQTVIGENLYSALLQFFQLFPQLRKNPFYVAGESYAGKYIPALCYTIHKRNPAAKETINLQGMAIGNGLMDPLHQISTGEYLYRIGFIDINAKEKLHAIEQETIDYIKKGENLKAMESLLRIPATFKNLTGDQDVYNILHMNKVNFTKYQDFIRNKRVKSAIHVGTINFASGNKVAQNLVEEYTQSVVPWISELLSFYRVLFYNGQLDIFMSYPSMLNFLQHLDFSAAAEYKTAPRYRWIVDDDTAGFVKNAGNLTEILVRNAGHMVPKDQPCWAHDMITRFTRNVPFHL